MPDENGYPVQATYNTCITQDAIKSDDVELLIMRHFERAVPKILEFIKANVSGGLKLNMVLREVPYYNGEPDWVHIHGTADVEEGGE